MRLRHHWDNLEVAGAADAVVAGRQGQWAGSVHRESDLENGRYKAFALDSAALGQP